MLAWLQSLTRGTRVAVIAASGALGLSILVVIGATIYNLAMPSFLAATAEKSSAPTFTALPTSTFTALPTPTFSSTPTPTPTPSGIPPAPASPIPPSVPRNVSLASAEWDWANVAWEAPSDIGDSAITGYAVEVSANGQSWQRVATTGPNARAYKVAGFQQSSSYEVSMRAINSSGVSSRSITVVLSTVSFVPTSPLDITSPGTNCTAAACNSFISFSAPTSTGISQVIDYQLGYSIDGGATWSFHSVGANVGTVQTGPMPPSATYQVVLYAVNTYGLGEWSGAISVH